jgi:hypothetical protein
MIAVVAPGARISDVRAFVKERFGTAPVTVYREESGATFRRLGPGYYPAHAFFSAAGKRVASFPGYPFE